MTVQELFDLTWKLHWGKDRYQKSRWASEVAGNYRRNIEPEFGKLEITALTPKMLRAWQRRLQDKPIAANRSLDHLHRMFVTAQQEELVPVGYNPCSLVPALPEKRRNRYATEEEIKRIKEVLDVKALSRHKRPSVAFLYCLLYSGARPLSIARAKRKDIRCFDFKDEVWGSISFHGKSTDDTGEEETILLPPKVLELMSHIREPNDGSLFGVGAPTGLWRAIAKEAGCPDLWMRDLRRTFSTVGLSNGVGIDVIGELLNHKSTQTTKIYAKLMQGARVKAQATIVEHLDRLRTEG